MAAPHRVVAIAHPILVTVRHHVARHTKDKHVLPNRVLTPKVASVMNLRLSPLREAREAVAADVVGGAVGDRYQLFVFGKVAVPYCVVGLLSMHKNKLNTLRVKEVFYSSSFAFVLDVHIQGLAAIYLAQLKNCGHQRKLPFSFS